MKNKLLSLLFIAFLPMAMMASPVLIDGIYYNLNTSAKTAEVTNSYGGELDEGNGTYSGTVNIPSSFSYNGITYSVTSIGVKAFYHCTGLTSITIPNSVTSIDFFAFGGCTGLTSITFPNSVTSIGMNAFSGCRGLTSVTIPNSVTSIDFYAFSGCSSLTSVTIPTSTSVADYVFNDCSSLTSIKGVVNDYAAFCNNVFCKQLSTIIIDEGGYAYEIYIQLINQEGEEIKEFVIPDGVTSIGNGAFKGCKGLTSVTIPNSVTNIGDEAFYNCTGLTSVTIPSSVTSMGGEVFYLCSSLTSVTVEWEEPLDILYVFFPIDQATLYVPYGTLSAYEDADGWKDFGNIVEIVPPSFNGLYYEFYENNTASVIAPPYGHYYTGAVSIPSSVIYNDVEYSVTSIGYSAFIDCSNLTSVTIPNSVTSIEGEAFHSCTSLTSINIGNGVMSIGNNAFGFCSSLTSFTIPSSVTSIGEYAFDGCSSLTSIIIPSSVTRIGEGALGYCSSLTNITVATGNTTYDSRNNCNAIIETSSKTLIAGCKNTIIPNSVTSLGRYAFGGSSLTFIDIPNSVTSIEEGAFCGCSNLTTVTIPNSVTSVGNYVFSACSSLTSVTIPTSVTNIGEEAFGGCTSLTSVTIGNSVTSIGEYAFAGCSNLTSVTVENPTPISISEYVFSNRTNATLYVPSGSLAAYKRANYWKEFKNIIEVDDRPEQTLSMTELPAMTYGDAACSLPETTAEGLTLTWTSGNTNVAVISGHTLAITGAGSATITATQAGNDDYSPFSQSFELTVNKAPLTITAKDYTIGQGLELPAFDATYTGFKNGDDESALTTKPTFSCPATSESEPGTYAITPGGAVALNYEMTYVAGTLTIIELHDILTAAVPTLRTGKNATLSISLDNEDELIAFEFFLTLPDGVSIAEDEDGYLDAVLNGERSDRHELNVEQDVDGSYHFLCYSNRNKALKGNSGELLSINLFCDEDAAPGTYEGLLSTVKFSDIDENPVMLPDLSFPIEVTNVTMGDVNNDDAIDVMDIVAMVNKIMGHPSSSFVFAAADLDGNDIIDVMDLVKEVRLVMSQTANAPATSFDLLSNSLSLQTGADGTVLLSVGDGIGYVASQFVVTLSPGQRLTDVTTDNRHTVTFEPVGEDQYAVVSYSSGNETYSCGSALLKLCVEGAGEVSVENATFVSEDMEKVLFQGASSGYTDGIRGITYDFSAPADIYSPLGILLRKDATSADGLKPGVYIINGNKYFKK